MAWLQVVQLFCATGFSHFQKQFSFSLHILDQHLSLIIRCDKTDAGLTSIHLHSSILGSCNTAQLHLTCSQDKDMQRWLPNKFDKDLETLRFITEKGLKVRLSSFSHLTEILEISTCSCCTGSQNTLTVPSKNNNTPNSLPHLERETKKKVLHPGHTPGKHGNCDLCWAQDEKQSAAGRSHVMRQSSWRQRGIHCKETTDWDRPLYCLPQYTKNCCKFIPWKYSTAGFWNSQLVIVKLLSISLARKFSSLKAGKAGQLPSSRIFKTPFETVTLEIIYHQMSCPPRRLL